MAFSCSAIITRSPSRGFCVTILNLASLTSTRPSWGVPPPKAVAFLGEADFGSHLGDDWQVFLRELLLVVLRKYSIAAVSPPVSTP